jgi:hypothetical protein
MTNMLTFKQAVDYINQGLKLKASGKSGMVTLKNASQEDCLVFQTEDGGERVSLVAPFLTRPADKKIQKILNLHLLHLNADLDTLGSLRISFNSDTNQYSLCNGAVSAGSVEDFVDYAEQVIKTAQYLHQELTEALSEKQSEDESNSQLSESNYLKA